MVIPAATTYFYLQNRKREIRREVKHRMMEGLHSDELVILTFDKEASAELQWEHSKEFEFENQMYDVVRSVEKGDSIEYHCWPDNEETQVNKQLASTALLLFQGDPDQKEKKDNVHAFYKRLFPPATAELRAPIYDYSRSNKTNFTPNLLVGFGEKLLQPPQYC